MIDLNEIYVFTKVVQAKSFTQAAKLLGIPKSTVSAKVSSLEKRLGVTLIKRTTRQLHLTDAGKNYLKRCIEGIELIQSAESEAAVTQSEPRGTLRITAPLDFSIPSLRERIDVFLKRYPKVEVELVFTDRFVDLVAEGIDVAIRAGALEDSSLIAKKIGTSRFVPLASPEYLKRAGRPAHPRDLTKHECLVFTTMEGPRLWTLHHGSERASVRVRGRLSADSLLVIRDFARAGNGIALIPSTFCQQELRDRALVPALPGWFSSPSPLHIVYPAQRFTPPHLQEFVDLVSDLSIT
jgi:DNA-binding transcriptional LysR family regulator